MRRPSMWFAGAASAILAISLAGCASTSGAGGGVLTLVTPSPSASAAPDSSGGSGASPAPSSSVPAPSDPAEAFLAYASCMRDHGVDMPDPEVKTADGGGSHGQTFFSVGSVGGVGAAGGPGGKPDPAFQAADDACHHFIASVTFSGDGPSTIPPEQQQAFLDFAQCMRDHGVDMPDPQFSGGGVSIMLGGPDGQGVDPQSPAFAAAQEACRHIMTDAGMDAPGSVSGAGDGAAPGGPVSGGFSVSGGPVSGPSSNSGAGTGGQP